MTATKSDEMRANVGIVVTPVVANEFRVLVALMSLRKGKRVYHSDALHEVIQRYREDLDAESRVTVA